MHQLTVKDINNINELLSYPYQRSWIWSRPEITDDHISSLIKLKNAYLNSYDILMIKQAFLDDALNQIKQLTDAYLEIEKEFLDNEEELKSKDSMYCKYASATDEILSIINNLD